jgi:predicted metal-dependent hydrolase
VQKAAHQLPLFAAEHEQPGQEPGFSVRKSSRAKRLSIKVFPRGRVEVVVPKRASVRSVKEFVEENREWIDRARDSFAEHFTPEAFVLPSIIRLPAIDRQVIVRYRPVADVKTVHFRFANGILNLTGNTGSEKHCVDALRRWLSGVARKEFEPRLRALSLVTESPFQKMHVRMQRRYLMVHELCHGRHMNHSRRFWKMVSKFEPGYRKLDRRLGESWRDVPAWLGIY